MLRPSTQPQPALAPAAETLAKELDDIAAMDVDALRERWRGTRGAPAPEALTKDLLTRALAHFLQEERLGGIPQRLRKLLANTVKSGSAPVRHLKAGSVIVREHNDVVHEVVVVTGGFMWRGETFSSLSTIALKITGTSWNGPRFFVLRKEAEAGPAVEALSAGQPAVTKLHRSPSVRKPVKRGGRGT